MIQQWSRLTGVSRIKNFTNENRVVATFVLEDDSAINPGQRVVKERDAGLAGVTIDAFEAISDVRNHAGKAFA